MLSVLANPIKPHLVVQYAARLGYPYRPPRDDMMMIDPAADFFR